MGNPREHLVNWLRNAHAPRDRSSSRRCHRDSARFNLPPRRRTTTMSNPQEHLLDWLRDAHAMEQQAEQML